MGVFIRKSTAITKRGFTMAELMIAVGIISLLTIAGMVSMQNQTRRARDQRRQSDLEQIRSALEMYRLTDINRAYPASSGGRPDVVLNPELVNLLPAIPRDPANSTRNSYYYRSPNPFAAQPTNQTYILCARLEAQAVGSACTAGACGTGGGCNVALTQP